MVQLCLKWTLRSAVLDEVCLFGTSSHNIQSLAYSHRQPVKGGFGEEGRACIRLGRCFIELDRLFRW